MNSGYTCICHTAYIYRQMEHWQWGLWMEPTWRWGKRWGMRISSSLAWPSQKLRNWSRKGELYSSLPEMCSHESQKLSSDTFTLPLPSHNPTHATFFLPCLYRYEPRKYYERNPELKKAIDQIHDGFFSPEDPGLFHSLTNHLLSHDKWV